MTNDTQISTRLRRLFLTRAGARRIAGGLGVACTAGLVAIAAAYFYLKAEVPTIRTLADYDPPQATKLYSDDGFLVEQLFVERRTVVPLEAIPEHTVRAFLAAEDGDFYDHEGLDYLGILRAAVKNLRPGAHLQGASTITQQTVKTMILGPERSYARKLREAILARELEQMLEKDDILHIYLNQIYFGSGAWGIEEAAQTYFGKSVRELTLGESALLASVPKNPSRYTLRHDPEAAKRRQRYVLDQMVSRGWVTAEQASVAAEEPDRVLAGPAPERSAYVGGAPHYVDWVARLLADRYGEEAIRSGGYTVYLGMSARHQAAAHAQLRRGLEDLARLQGYPGASLRIEVDRYQRYTATLRSVLERRRQKLLARAAGNPTTDTLLVWDLSAATAEDLADEEALKRAVRVRLLRPAQRLVGVISQVDSVGDVAQIDLGDCVGRIGLAQLHWARRFSADRKTPPPRDPAEVFQRGDLVTVEVKALPRAGADRPEGGRPVVDVDVIPEVRVQGSLVAVDPHTRWVRALVGGYAQRRGGFNRATQALRQPGSAFKPVVYAAGLAAGEITPASQCADTPIVIRDQWTGEAWKPENYEDGRYDGNITFRTALMRSKNTCSVKLIERLGPEKVIEMARALGISSALPENLTLALGTGDLTVLELANAYATIAAGGLYAEPIFVRKVVDRRGRVVEETRAHLEERIDPAVAYVLTNMMRSVVEEGTATRALVLDRPLAGKTGTSNRSRNVWFSGFSAELVATVWVGFDDNASLGRVTGSSGALPTWIRFMDDALTGVPRRDFVPPADVVFAQVDAETGEPSTGVGSIEQAFVAGTEPSESKRPLPSIFFEDESVAVP